MTLTFGAQATIGSLRYDTHVTNARVSLGLAPRPGSARLCVPPQVRVDAVPGDDASVLLHGEHADVETIGGTVVSVDRSLDHTTVVVTDALGRLAMLRPGTTFEQQSAGAIITAFADEAGIPTGAIDADTELLTYVADQYRTALEHTARLASWAGSTASGSPDGGLVVAPLPTGPAERALRYGREIATLRIRRRGVAVDGVWAGSGPAGNVSAPDAHLQTTTVVPDGAPGPDARTMRLPAHALRTPAAATDATTAAAKHNSGLQLHATCWLQPEIRPGMSIEIADAPQPDSIGPWFVTAVTHDLGPGPRGITRLRAHQLGDGGGLLAALLGAVGGLL